MFRVLHSVVTVAALLACPFNCLGHRAGGCAGAERSKTCACCRHRCERPSPRIADARTNQQPTPEAPGDECQCGNCVCHGAVLTGGQPELIAAPTVLWLDVVNLSSGTLAITARAVVAADESPPRARPTGRMLRHALQSLLV